MKEYAGEIVGVIAVMCGLTSFTLKADWWGVAYMVITLGWVGIAFVWHRRARMLAKELSWKRDNP